MATKTVYPSAYTYLEGGSSSTHYGASSLKTFFYAATNLGEAQPTQGVKNAAVLQFTRPSDLRYALIKSVTLWMKYDKVHPGSTTDIDALSVASYSTESDLSAISWTNVKSSGVVGDWLQSGSLYTSYPTPFNWQVAVTSIYNGDLSNNKVTFIVCGGGTVGSAAGASPVQYGYIDPNNCYLVIDYEAGSQPAPTPLYPKDVTLVEPSSLLFSWQFNGATEAVQTAAVLEYKEENDANYTVVNLTQSGYSYTLNQALPVGSYQWRVKVTNDAGTTSGYSDVAYFNIVGKPASPIINEPANKTLTTISWNTTNQQACELILADQSGKELYHETLATGDTVYKPNFFLNGAYMFSVRVMNDSQLWSDWAQRAFVINAAGPTAATIALGTAPIVPGVHLTFTLPADAEAVLMRSQGGKEKVLAKLELSDTEYTDFTVASGIAYTYYVRTYVDGYTDSTTVQTTVTFDGAIISSDDTALVLDRSDEKFLPHSEEITRAFSLMNFSGREFPMIERGEFTTVEFSRRFHVTAAQKKILDKLSKEESVFYRDNKDNAYPAGMKKVHYEGFMNDGYMATIDLVRLNEEEVVVNV